MTRIIVSPKANADFLDILDYLTNLAGYVVANKYASDLAEIYDRLSMFPEIGSSRPSLGSQARIMVISPYVVVYDYLRENDTVRIVRIVDGRRNVTRRLVRG
jgi:plasmid stabilization system protein ParE